MSGLSLLLYVVITFSSYPDEYILSTKTETIMNSKKVKIQQTFIESGIKSTIVTRFKRIKFPTYPEELPKKRPLKLSSP